MNSFLAAVRFLTIIPIPGELGKGPSALAGSLLYFPLVGLVIGALAAGLAYSCWLLFDPLPAAVLAVIILLLISGGLHMDGLADTADGFFSSRSPARMLEIMRDSRVGAMGVMAIVLTLALKIAALTVHPRQSIWAVVLLMPLAGRCALLVLMAILPYARPEGGLATLFYTRSSRGAALGGAALLLLTSWLAAGPAGVAAGAASLVAVLLFAGWCRGKIGGATGDTLGAGCELAETMVALAMCAKPVMAWLG